MSACSKQVVNSCGTVIINDDDDNNDDYFH